ncbi:transposase, partial [Veillonella tobetsuensis]|uniref:transposase n=1 Tax=Veillonella tobetsuensis TaxID=1110546 RepID=UPI001485AB0F
LSNTGIKLRINSSIQVEGAFGVLKQDLGFRRFLHRGSGKVNKMLYLLAMGFNIEKLHNRIQAGRVNTTLFTAKETA